MSVTYTCPECGTVLRPKAPLPAGKKVKCPECGAIFAPAAAAAGAAVAGKPGRPAAKPAPAKKKDDDEWGDTKPYVITEDTGPKPEKITFDQIRDRFPKSARGPAQKEVVRPANTMLAMQAQGKKITTIHRVSPDSVNDGTPNLTTRERKAS